MTNRETLFGWLYGAKATQLVGVFNRLRVADLLANGASTAETLGKACEIAPERMVRLLRGFVEIGLCAEGEQATFTLTDLGVLLRTDRSLHNLVQLLTDPATDRSWAHLEQGVRSGRGGFHEAYGMSIFEYMEGRPDLRALYDDAMGELTANVAEEVAACYDFAPYPTVTDVGGGDGTLLAAILRRYPAVRGRVFDRADGDFFHSVPAGAALYLLKWIVHDWADDDATTILRNCRAALPEHGRLLIIERILAERSPRDPELTDLHMLMIYGGKERTLDEFRALCTSAGLAITDVVPLPSGLSLIETAVEP